MKHARIGESMTCSFPGRYQSGWVQRRQRMEDVSGGFILSSPSLAIDQSLKSRPASALIGVSDWHYWRLVASILVGVSYPSSSYFYFFFSILVAGREGCGCSVQSMCILASMFCTVCTSSMYTLHSMLHERCSVEARCKFPRCW